MSHKSGHPDCSAASAYALNLLEHDLPLTLRYHTVWHTRDEVVPRVLWLAEREALPPEDTLMACVGAWYHDVGFVRQQEDHESVGADIAAEALAGLGFTDGQIEIARSIILATRLPQSPRTLVEQIVADADLDVLGRSDFFIRNRALRAEAVNGGRIPSDEVWYRQQASFMRAHRYFTSTARLERTAGKQANLRALEARIEMARQQDHPASYSPQSGVKPIRERMTEWTR